MKYSSISAARSSGKITTLIRTARKIHMLITAILIVTGTPAIGNVKLIGGRGKVVV
jgi:hypothetical protein